MLTLPSPAKLNLFLEVTGKRPDGYHDIESVFLEIDLADTLTVETAEPHDISLTCDTPGLPTDDTNLVIKAACALARECGVREGARFTLTKRIPMGSGLGGGSSNAAAALRLANRLWRTGLSDPELARLGAGIGSDVPFFIHGGLCLCRGRGEAVTPLPAFVPGVPLGLALPAIHSDTAAAYRGLRLPAPDARRRADECIQALARNDPEALAAAAFNRFEPTVFAALPELGRLHRELAALTGRGPWLSGSGSGLWFIGDAAAVRGAASAAGLMGAPGKPGLRLLAVRGFHMIGHGANSAAR